MKLRGAEQVRDNARPADDLRFDASGQRLLAAIPAEGVSVWEAVQGTRVGATLTPPSGWTVSNAWFGPDGDTVIGRIVREGAAAGASGRLVRWQLSDGRLDEQSWGTQETGPVTVSADGSTLVRCTADGVLQAWDLAGEPKVKRQYSTGQLGLVCPLFVPRLDRTGRFLLNPAQRFGGAWAGTGAWCWTSRKGCPPRSTCPPPRSRTSSSRVPRRCRRSASPDLPRR